MRRAVAIDLGATSARFALGEWDEGRPLAADSITFQIIEQIPHAPLEWNGHDVWDIDLLRGFCVKALRFAKENGASSIGIDTWGVDQGFVDAEGKLLQPPICYRDASHSRVFDSLHEQRSWLYEQTGIQHQPFNTLYQLLARKEDSPKLFDTGNQWLLLPDLLLHMLGARRGYERSIASTTQLTDRSGNWNSAVFERFGLPVPASPVVGAELAGETEGVTLMRVSGHDTASAVYAMVGESSDAVFCNIGTWALVGTVADQPDFSPWAEQHNLTNERTSDNRVRLLTNIPGFFILDRLHKELRISIPMSAWIDGADISTSERIDTFNPSLYAPKSMIEAFTSLLGCSNPDPELLAGIALLSLVDAIAHRAKLFGRNEICLGGGAARNETLRSLIASRSGLKVTFSHAESTVLGNLMQQFRLGAAS